MQKKWVLSGLLLLCFSASAEWKFLFTTQIEPWRPGSKGMRVDHYIGEYSINAESPFLEIQVLQNFTTLESGTGPKRNWSVVKQERSNGKKSTLMRTSRRFIGLSAATQQVSKSHLKDRSLFSTEPELITFLLN